MPEPVSIAAGVIGLIGSLVKLNEVRSDIFGAKDEINSLFREVDSLMNVLERLQNLKRMPDTLSKDLLEALKDCNQTVEKVEFLLLRSSLSQFRGLYWAYTGKKEVLQHCRELAAQKTTIGIILNLSSLHAHSEVGDKVDQILAEIQDLRHDRPANESTLRHIQCYAESVSGQSSTTYVDEDFMNLSTDTPWDDVLLPKHSVRHGPPAGMSNWQYPFYEGLDVDLRDDRTSGRYKLHRTLSGHRSGVSSVVFSKDGRQLLSGSWHGGIRLWDIETERTIKSIQGHSDDTTSVVFVGDETILASASADTTIKFWDASSGSLLRRLDDHKDRVSGLAYAENSGELASASGDGTTRVWNVETGSAVRTLRGDGGGSWSVAITEDGRQLISGSGDGTISIWDLRAKSAARTLEGHTDGVRSIAVSAGKLASGSWDRTVRLWDVRAGSAAQVIPNQGDHISSVVFVGRQWLAAGSGDDSAFKLWDIETGVLAQNLQTDGGSISSIAFSASNGGQLASGSGDRTIGLWNVEYGIWKQMN